MLRLKAKTNAKMKQPANTNVAFYNTAFTIYHSIQSAAAVVHDADVDVVRYVDRRVSDGGRRDGVEGRFTDRSRTRRRTH